MLRFVAVPVPLHRIAVRVRVWVYLRCAAAETVGGGAPVEAGMVPGHAGQQQLLSLQLCLTVRQQQALVALQARIVLTSFAEPDPDPEDT
jgi:hypothetical protein